uniref:Uncharacterized protein n=1 Tax=Caenorhabditis japonica TaxID=281687 RepID=A0A8R1IS44_CAEJA
MVWADQLGGLPKYGIGQQPFTIQEDWAPSHVLDAHFLGYCFIPKSQSFGYFVWGHLESKVLARSQPHIEYLKQAPLRSNGNPKKRVRLNMNFYYLLVALLLVTVNAMQKPCERRHHHEGGSGSEEVVIIGAIRPGEK